MLSDETGMNTIIARMHSFRKLDSSAVVEDNVELNKTLSRMTLRDLAEADFSSDNEVEGDPESGAAAAMPQRRELQDVSPPRGELAQVGRNAAKLNARLSLFHPSSSPAPLFQDKSAASSSDLGGEAMQHRRTYRFKEVVHHDGRSLEDSTFSHFSRQIQQCQTQCAFLDKAGKSIEVERRDQWWKPKYKPSQDTPRSVAERLELVLPETWLESEVSSYTELRESLHQHIGQVKTLESTYAESAMGITDWRPLREQLMLAPDQSGDSEDPSELLTLGSQMEAQLATLSQDRHSSSASQAHARPLRDAPVFSNFGSDLMHPSHSLSPACYNLGEPPNTVELKASAVTVVLDGLKSQLAAKLADIERESSARCDGVTDWIPLKDFSGTLRSGELPSMGAVDATECHRSESDVGRTAWRPLPEPLFLRETASWGFVRASSVLPTGVVRSAPVF